MEPEHRKYKIATRRNFNSRKLSETLKVSTAYVSRALNFDLFTFKARKIRHEAINNHGGILLESLNNNKDKQK